jgi:membrane protein DedA with SNARE-associated domain
MSGLLDTAAQLASPWAYVVLALAAAAEAAAFVGVVVPGETAMLLGGFLAFQGRVSLGWMMAAGAAGAVVGDSVGYAIGRRLGEPVKRSRLGRRVGRQRWARAEAYLRAKGGRAVFLGRFVGLLRALVPALAGMSRMPYRTFLPWNLAGGVIWAPGFVLLGYLAGSSYRQVERIVGRASLLLLLVVVLAGALVVGARRFARRPDRLRALVDRQLERRWVARLRGRRTCSRATTSRCWTGGVRRVVVAERKPWLTPLVQAITELGNAAVLIGLIALAGLGWWTRTRSWRPLWLLASAYLGAEVLSDTVKDLTHRPRPPAAQAIGHLTGFAFPSGHATKATAVYGMLAALLAAATSSWARKVALWTAALLVAGLVGVSRLYLGAHWPTDVLGGFALGGAWLLAVLTAVRTVDALRTGRQPNARDRSGVPGARYPKMAARRGWR